MVTRGAGFFGEAASQDEEGSRLTAATELADAQSARKAAKALGGWQTTNLLACGMSAEKSQEGCDKANLSPSLTINVDISRVVHSDSWGIRVSHPLRAPLPHLRSSRLGEVPVGSLSIERAGKLAIATG